VEVRQGPWIDPGWETPGASAADTSEQALITVALVLLGLSGLAGFLFRRRASRR
jgi:hypothetical protein